MDPLHSAAPAGNPGNSSTGVQIVAVDGLMIRTLELKGLLCFRCLLLEDPRLPEPGPGECQARTEDFLLLVTGEKSGIRIAVGGEQILGYAMFGRPGLFRYLDRLPFEMKQDALLIAALYATPDARADNVDVDLLVAVMDFAREKGFEVVQAVCRPESGLKPEGRAELFQAAGFEVSEPVHGLCLAETAIEAWDQAEKESDFPSA